MEEIRQVFRESEILKKIQSVLIAGGEPFLRKDFAEIIFSLYEMNPDLLTFIPSNGQEPDIIEEKLKIIKHNFIKSGISGDNLFVGFSIDGVGDIHDRMRGVRGSFQKVLQSIERLKKIQYTKMPCIAFTFTPDNYTDFPNVHDLSKQLNVRLIIQFAQTSDIFYDNRVKQFKWSGEQLAEIREFLIRAGYMGSESSSLWADRLFSVDRFFYEYLLDYQQKPHRSFKCFSGTHSCYMDPYGNIYPCIMLDKSYGNVREQNFDSLWKSERARKIRKYISQYKCHCPSPCDIPNSLKRNCSIVAWNIRSMVFHR